MFPKKIYIPLCQKCGHPLTDIIESYKGTDHIYWDEKNETYTIDLPMGRADEPSTFTCNRCGKRLNKEQVAFLQDHRE